MALNPAAVGTVGAPYQISWTSKDSLLYAVSLNVGSDQLQYVTENSTVENVLAELKQCCDKLPPGNLNSPSTWQPVQTQTLHHTLHKAQLALLARNTRLAREFLKVFNQEFQKFPGQASFTPPATRSDADTPDNTPEKILANALATRGNLVPSIAGLAESKDAIVNNRRLAELAAARSFASADLLQPLLLLSPHAPRAARAAALCCFSSSSSRRLRSSSSTSSSVTEP